MRLVISAPNIKKFVEDLNTLIATGRVNSKRYVACVGASGIVLLPTVTSRHSHSVWFLGFEELEDFRNAVEELKKRGFQIIEKCTAYPEQ